MVEIIMPDGTFLSSIIASGAGDFMADGSVPMTGDLSIDKATPVIELDTSATSSMIKFLQATVLKGQIWTSNNYFMMKSYAGDLQIVGPSSVGMNIDFITNDVTRFRIEDSTLTAVVPLAMSSYKITGLAAPTTDYDGATKKYVDDNVGGAGDFMADGSVPMTGNLLIDKASPVIELDTSATSSFLKLSQASTVRGQLWASDTILMLKSMTGDLQLISASSAGKKIDFITNDVTRFRIEDAAATLAVPLAMSDNKITGLAAPTVNGNALRYEHLTADDHTQYLLINGTRAMTGNLMLDMASPVIELDTSATSAFLKFSQASAIKGQIWTSNDYFMMKSMVDDLQLSSASSAGKTIDFITNDITRFRIADSELATTVPFAMGSNKITGLATPTTDYDGATKKYVDDNMGGAGDFMADGSVPMTGNLNMNGHMIQSCNEIQTTTSILFKKV